MDSQTYQLNKKKYHPSGEGRFLSILLCVDTVHLHDVFYHGRYSSTLLRIAHSAPRYRFAWRMVEDLDHWSVGIFASLYTFNSSRWSLQNQLCTTHQQVKQGKTRLKAPKKVVMMFGFSLMAHGAGYLLKLSWNRSTDLPRQIGKKQAFFSPDITLIGLQLSMTSCHFILLMGYLCAWQSFLPRHRRMKGLRGTHYGLVI